MRFLISVPEILHKALKEESKHRGQTLTGMIRGILWDWIQEQREVGEPPANKEIERRKTR